MAFLNPIQEKYNKISDKEVIDMLAENAKYIIDLAKKCGFKLFYQTIRTIDPRRKYTSRTIGKIFSEHVLVFRKSTNREITSRDIGEYILSVLKTLKVSNKNLKKKTEAISMAHQIIKSIDNELSLIEKQLRSREIDRQIYQFFETLLNR